MESFPINRRRLTVVAAALLLVCLQGVSAQSATACTTPTDIVFVVDDSSYVSSSANWQQIETFMDSFIQGSNVGQTATQFGLVVYTDSATLTIPLNQYTSASALVNAVTATTNLGKGGSDIYAGLNMARTQVLSLLFNYGARPDVRQVIILLTDGTATDDIGLTVPEANTDYQSGIIVFAIGVGSQLNLTQLQLISAPPHAQGSNYWTVPSFTALQTLVQPLLTATCNPPKTTTAACNAADIVFAFDINQNSLYYTYLQDFIVQFISLYLPIGTQANQVAAVTYDNRQAYLQFTLSANPTEAQVKKAIENIPFVPTPAPADPDFALQLINTSIFASPSGGARGGNVQKIIVIMTDNALPNPIAAAQIAALYRAQGVRVFAIGLTANIAVTDLQTMSTTANDIMSSVSYVYLLPKVQLLTSLLCNPGTSIAVACPAIADIVLILDESTSIVAAQGGYDNWYTYILGFAESIANSFPISPILTQVGVMEFSSNPEVEFYMNMYSNRSSLMNAIANLQINGGQTDIAAALRTCRTTMFAQGNGVRMNVPHIAFLVTDGQANIEADQTQIEANLTKAAGIEIFTVGMTNQVNVQQLQQIASPPFATHYYYVTDYSKLAQVLNDLVAQACLNLPTVPTTLPTTTSPSTTTPTTTTTTPTTTTTTPTTTTTTPTTTTTTPTTTTTTPTTTTTTPTTTTTKPTTTTSTTTTSTTTTPTTTTSTTTTPTTTTSTTTTSTTTTPTTTTKATSPTVVTLNGAVGQTTRGGNVVAPDQGSCPNKVDVVFIVDKTQNMNYQYYESYLIGFLQLVVSNIQVDTLNARVGAVTFSEEPTVEFYLGNYSSGANVINALQAISYGGQTPNLAAAITVATTLFTNPALGARSGVNWVAVIVTDNPSASQPATLAAAAAMRAAGISIVTVGVGTNLDTYELSAACTYPPSANMFTVTTARNLSTLVSPVSAVLCSPTSCASSGCKSTCQQMLNAIQCTCSPGTAGPTCSNTCNNGGDIVFAVTTSSNLGLPYVQALTTFMGTLISSFDATSSANGPTVSRIGMVTYGANATIQFNLNTYAGQPNTSNLLQAINVQNTPSTGDNLAQAINVARTQMFTAANGARNGFPKYLVIMMDGQSDNITGALAEAMAARNAGISILVISIGTSINYMELYALASAPTSLNVYAAATTASLTSAWTSVIASSICSNKNYCGSSPCLNGATCTSILNGYSCGPCPLTPTPSTGFNCERPCSGVIDLVFVLDDSGTVHQERWQYVLQFVINVVQNLDVSPTRTQVGLIYYSNTAYVGFTLNQFTNRQDVIDAINNTIPYIGNTTDLYTALLLLRTTMFTATAGDRPNAPNYAIVVANGDSTMDRSLSIPEGVQNRLENTTIFTVAVETQEYNSSELAGIASFPRNVTMMYVPSFPALPGSYGMVVNAICQSVNYCSPNPCLNGGTCSSQLGMYVCTCPEGIAGVNCERTCNKPLDVVFILDNSGSVQQEYQQSVDFTRAVVQGLDINSGLVRVGAIAFSNEIVGQFYLNSNLDSAQSVYNSLDFYNVFGTTNTPAALEDAYNTQFTAQYGDRPSVPDVLIIVTDGYSNVNQTRTVPDAVTLKNSGVTIYSIAVGLNPQWSELDGMASSPSSYYVIPLPTIGNITMTANLLLNELCGTVLT